VKTRILYAVAGILAGGLLWAGFVHPRLQDRSREQKKILTAAGWREARVVPSREVVAAAPDVDTRPLLESGAEPAAAGRVVTAPEYVYLPADCPATEPPPSAGQQGVRADADRSVPPPLKIQIEGQMIAGLTDRNSPYAKARLWADLSRGDWFERREFRLEEVDFSFSKRLMRAINRGAGPRFSTTPRPFYRWRTGWVAGGGACWNGAAPDLCLFAGYAIQF
jgi:hypothetical protein